MENPQETVKKYKFMTPAHLVFPCHRGPGLLLPTCFRSPAICAPFACLPLPLLCSVCDWLCSEAPFQFSACQTLSYLMFLQATRYPGTFSPAISRLDLRRFVWVMCFNSGTEFSSAAPSGSCSLRLKTQSDLLGTQQESLTQFIVYILHFVTKLYVYCAFISISIISFVCAFQNLQNMPYDVTRLMSGQVYYWTSRINLGGESK